jgi:hypothetical protein
MKRIRIQKEFLKVGMLPDEFAYLLGLAKRCELKPNDVMRRCLLMAGESLAQKMAPVSVKAIVIKKARKS